MFQLDQALALVRKLPLEENAQLVVSVVRTTLESVGIDMNAVLGEASRRLEELRERIQSVDTQIGELEGRVRELQERRQEIDGELQDVDTFIRRFRAGENGQESAPAARAPVPAGRPEALAEEDDEEGLDEPES